MEKSSPVNIIVITQNVIVDSLAMIADQLDLQLTTVIVSTQHLFPFERDKIDEAFRNVEYREFAELLTDREMEKCDIDAFEGFHVNVLAYYAEIKQRKNQLIVDKINEQYHPAGKYLVCSDLGVDKDVWINNGYKEFAAEYYYTREESSQKDVPTQKSIVSAVKGMLANKKAWSKKPIYSAKIDGKKYVFFGEMPRIEYRLHGDFTLDQKENKRYFIDFYSSHLLKKTLPRKNVVRFSTLHESVRWQFPSVGSYPLYIAQDGYLPPNYSSRYLYFVPKNVTYYAWDKLGMELFENQHLNVELIPIRKKLYMPEPAFHSHIKKVLIVASGAGDWTALKNRSDDDRLVELFGEIAKQFPDVQFVFRCHPTWIHPEHQGVNSINRVIEYYRSLGIDNIRTSENIPVSSVNNFRFSYSRNSLEEDLRDTDVVFGEHSVSMIDAAFKQIPFASVNVTGRRDFFCGMTDLGFPHCESIQEVADFLNNISNVALQERYLDAVKEYNKMTDEE